MFKTPILFLIFNRLDTAQKVFEKIKEQKPKYLYIAADGPRKNKVGEAEACKRTREEILKQIDRDCELKTLFRDENLGCKKAVSGAITRFFENVEQGIILEDDCLPDPSFFRFCETMLEKYKDDERIMHVGGCCFLPEKYQKNNRYYFSKYNFIRGWASRRRARNLYDINMNFFPEFKNEGYIYGLTNNFFSKRVWLNHFENTYKNKNDTWDYQRTYSVLINHGISILPQVNLISNIGFSSEALHTKNSLGLGNRKTNKILFKELVEPNIKIPNKKYDEYVEQKVFFTFKVYVANLLRKLGIYKIIARILGYNT